MNKLTLIKKPTDDSLIQATFCYIPILPSFTMFVAMYKEDSITIGKDLDWEDMEKQINISEVPEGLLFERMTFSYKSAGSVLKEPNMLNIGITIPILLKTEIKDALTACIRKAIKKQGVDVELSKHREDSNDYVVLADGKKKKFSGIAKEIVQDGEALYICTSPIFGFKEEEKELWRKLYKLDSAKVQLKGDIKDLFDIVGGLREANPNIDPEQLKEDFIQLFTERFDLVVEERELTEDELLDIKELKEAMINADWVRYKKIPLGLRPKVQKLLE